MERSAFSRFIENCASWIGFDVWDWFAFLVASISLYVAYVTFKSQRRTEKNTQALLTLDAQLMLFSDLFLKLYSILMIVLCERIRKIRTKEVLYELLEYKVDLKKCEEEGGICNDKTFTDPELSGLYISDVPESLEKHFEMLSEGCRTYRELVAFPQDFMIPAHNIHPELFYNNEFQFLLINRLVCHIDDFNRKYEYILQQKNLPDLEMLGEDVSRIARETRDTVKEIYLFNDKVQKLYSGIIANQIDEIDAFKCPVDADVTENHADDVKLYMDAFRITDGRIRNNIRKIISSRTSLLKDSHFDYEKDADFTIKTKAKAERLVSMGFDLLYEKKYSFSFRCAQALVDYLSGEAKTEEDSNGVNDLKDKVVELVKSLNYCGDEAVWEDSIQLMEALSIMD